MKIADVVEHWFQAHFHNNTFFQNEQLFSYVLAAKQDLLKHLEAAFTTRVETALEETPNSANKTVSSKR